MSPTEYKERMAALQAEMMALAEEYYSGIINEYINRSEAGTWVNVSALAREFGVSQSNLQRRLKKSA